ncbi:MAG: putative DNA-binding domain-containing protein [Methylotenera sp.]|nr:putative DNA-binding domain-containing protein [Methylotenera sp.]
MTINIPSFQKYQQEFTAYLRDPVNQQRPQNVAPKRMDVYKEIVFNNLFESVSACFPVAQKVIGKRAWLKLVRGFFCNHSANTPIFRKIPEEFLSYLTSINHSDEASLPPYLTSLCHYEWVELLVSSMVNLTDEVASHDRAINLTGDLLENEPAFTPTMQLLNYEYAVQKISPHYKPTDKVNTQLLVYRDAKYAVNFIELNPVTYRLIKLLQEKGTTSKCALNTIANELGLLQAESVIMFGLDVLEALRSQGVILGVYKDN